jgi:hypothetical protein
MQQQALFKYVVFEYILFKDNEKCERTIIVTIS